MAVLISIERAALFIGGSFGACLPFMSAEPALWYLLLGVVFLLMGMAASAVRRLPLTSALIYLAVGVALGPQGMAFFSFPVVERSDVLERVSEIAVIISLFSAGLKLRLPWDDPKWKQPFRLAFVSMLITVFLVTAFGVYALQLSWGAAVLLGAILAPTDPVLASEVQVTSPQDPDQLRFDLTAEAGLNDGAAFPFVMLGLGLLGLHDLGAYGWKWLVVDVFWAAAGGLAIGASLGTGVAYLVVWLRQRRKETLLLDDFLALGLIALSYGAALLLHGYGFLAVFAAGLALRRAERRISGEKPGRTPKEPAPTTEAILSFNEQLERVGEVAMVLLLGGMLWLRPGTLRDLWLLPVVFLFIRPVSVFLGLWKSGLPGRQVKLVSWFGIRGIGSLYYLAFAIQHGVTPVLAERLAFLTLAVVTVSIVVHGISATPLMNLYQRRSR